MPLNLAKYYLNELVGITKGKIEIVPDVLKCHENSTIVLRRDVDGGGEILISGAFEFVHNFLGQIENGTLRLFPLQ